MFQKKFFRSVGIVPVVLLAMLLVLIVANQVSAHSEAPESGVIHTCVNNNSGELKIVGDDESCKKNQESVDWNIQGIPGEDGEDGEDGDKGDKGEDGEDGSNGENGDPGTSSWVDGSGNVTTKADVLDVGIGTLNSGGESVLVTTNGSALGPVIRLETTDIDGGQIEWRTGSSSGRHFNIDQYGDTLRFFTERDSDNLVGKIRMIITESGNVGIGTADTDVKLHVSGGKDTRIRIEDPTQAWSWSAGWKIEGDFSLIQEGISGDRIYIAQNGNVGIGKIAPAVKLDVNGIVRTVALQVISDARLKTDIQPITSPLDKVLALRGVTFNWNSDSGFGDGTQIGLIAQEVENVLPELVNTSSDGYKSVEYGNLVAVLVEAIEELEARITELENR